MKSESRSLGYGVCWCVFGVRWKGLEFRGVWDGLGGNWGDDGERGERGEGVRRVGGKLGRGKFD